MNLGYAIQTSLGYVLPRWEEKINDVITLRFSARLKGKISQEMQ